jgi:hypothetical protein
MQLSVLNPRLAMVLALAMAMAPAVSMAQAAAGQKPAAPAAPAPAKKPAAPAPATPVTASPAKGTVARYTATAAPALKGVAGETITVDIIRWSTDEEKDKIVAAFAKDGEKSAAPALAAAPNIGYIWRSGSAFGSFIRYAYRFKAADGEHLVIATDSDLVSWQAAGAKPGAPMTILEIVTSGAGVATGKTSLGGKIIADAEAKSLRIDGYTGAPVALRGVRHVKGS